MSLFSKVGKLCIASAVVASFGLMAVGCSSSDDGAISDKARLNVIMGITEVSAKGYEVPATTTQYELELYGKNGAPIGDIAEYTETKTETSESWRDLGHGQIMISLDLSTEYISKTEAMMVRCYDKEDNFLGMYTKKLQLAPTGPSTVDFTFSSSPVFVKAEEVEEAIALNLKTEPELDKNGKATVIVGDSIAFVEAQPTYVGDKDFEFVLGDKVAGEELAISTEGETSDISIEKNVVTGVKATAEPVKLRVSCVISGMNASEIIDLMVENIPELEKFYVLPYWVKLNEGGTGLLDFEDNELDPEEISVLVNMLVGDKSDISVFGLHKDGRYRAVAAEDVTLSSDTEGIVSIDGLTVEGLASGTAKIQGRIEELDKNSENVATVVVTNP